MLFGLDELGTYSAVVRFIILCGYASIGMLAAYGMTRWTTAASRWKAVGWLVVALGWFTFYLILASGDIAVLPEASQPPALVSRLLHIPVLGLGIATLIMLNDREQDIRRLWLDLEEYLNDADGE